MVEVSLFITVHLAQHVSWACTLHGATKHIPCILCYEKKKHFCHWWNNTFPAKLHLLRIISKVSTCLFIDCQQICS